MPRYVKQWDMFSCGAIAVLNARKWAGRRTTIAHDYKKLRKRAQVSPDTGGCTLQGIDRTLRSCEEIIVRRTKRRTARNVLRHVNKGGSAVITVRALFNKRVGFESHVIFVLGRSRSGKSVKIVNEYPGWPTVSHIRRSTFARYMKRSKKSIYTNPHVWLISKARS